MKLKKLSRGTNARKRLFDSLIVSLIEHEKVVTTVTKAWVIKREIEKLVTRAKEGTVSARRLVLQELPHPVAVAKLFSDIAPRFADRNGGYVRKARLGFRMGDNTQEAVLFWTVGKKVVEKAPKIEEKKKVKKSTKEKTKK